jgi:hypothetical protein
MLGVRNERVAGQLPNSAGIKKPFRNPKRWRDNNQKKIMEMPIAKAGKPMMAKTFRSTRGSLLSRVSRFVNKFFG